MPTKYETLVIGGAAMLGGLIYILRLLRRMAAAIDFWTSLPAEHNQLVLATKANTEAIARLTERVDVLVGATARRRPR